jgi:hypothetical protein
MKSAQALKLYFYGIPWPFYKMACFSQRNNGAPGGIRIRVLIRNESKSHGVLLTKQTL